MYIEKTIYSGKMLEVEVHKTFTIDKKKHRKPRRKKTKEKKKVINEINAKKHVIRLIHANFTEIDLAVTLSYSKDTLPSNLEEARKDFNKYIDRIKYHLKKKGLPTPKYIGVIEYGEKNKNLHHHLIISGYIDRDVLEKLWTKINKGRANSRRLQEDDFGFEGIAKYMLKNPEGKKRYSRSKNLKKPVVKVKKHKYTRKKVWDLAHSQGGHELEKEFEGYKMCEFKTFVDEMLGLIFIKAKLKKRE